MSSKKKVVAKKESSSSGSSYYSSSSGSSSSESSSGSDTSTATATSTTSKASTASKASVASALSKTSKKSVKKEKVAADKEKRVDREESLSSPRAPPPPPVRPKPESIILTAGQAIITCNASGKIISANVAAQALFHYTLGEFLDQNVSMLMPSPYREKHDNWIAAYVATRTRRVIGSVRQFPGVRKGGDELQLSIAVSEVVVGATSFFTAIFHNHTERNAEEEARAQTDQAVAIRAQTVVDECPVALIVASTVGIVKRYSKKAEELLWFSEDDILGQSIRLIMPRAISRVHHTFVEKYMRTGEAHAIGKTRPVKALRKDGTEVPIMITVCEFVVENETFFAATMLPQEACVMRPKMHDACTETEWSILDELAGGVQNLEAPALLTRLSDVHMQLRRERALRSQEQVRHLAEVEELRSGYARLLGQMDAVPALASMVRAEVKHGLHQHGADTGLRPLSPVKPLGYYGSASTSPDISRPVTPNGSRPSTPTSKALAKALPPIAMLPGDVRSKSTPSTFRRWDDS